MFSALRFTKQLFTVFCLFGASYACAQLTPLDDKFLSEIDGQAFINVQDDTLSGNSTKYTRINFGITGQVQVNIDNFKLGEYTRSGESNPADIEIENFALGHIEGNTIVPFNITDPYIEIAYNNGVADGFRIGFKEAHGSLSGDIKALTGYVPVKISGRAEPLRDSAGFWNSLALSAIGVGDNTIVEADAELVNSSGNPDQIRSTMTGIPNGGVLNVPGNGFSDLIIGLFSSSNCEILGIATCFPLSSYKTLPVGSAANPAKGFFVSVSKTNGLQWKDLESGGAVNVTQGAFMYLPKVNGQAAITVDFNDALNGIPRKDTCFGSATYGC